MILSEIVNKVFEEHPRAVEDAKTMEEAVQYLAGLVLRETKGECLMSLVYELIRERLGIKDG